MQAVILAAGRSTRTHPLTETRPKPLIPVWGRPFLEYQLRQLPDLVRDVFIIVGYRREQIEAHFGSLHEGRRIHYVSQAHQRGTADALLAARPHIGDRTLVLNGDDFYHRDDLTVLAQKGRGLFVTKAKDPQNRAVVTLENDRLTDIVEKPRAPSPDAWCSVGGYCIEREDLAYLDELRPSVRGELELPDFILRLARDHAVRPHFMRNLWMPLTYAWDVLDVMNVFWESRERARELGLEANGRRFSDVLLDGPVFVGEGAVIGRGARLKGPLALGAGSSVGDGAVVDNIVALPGARIGNEAVVESSVLGAGASVGDAATLRSAPGHQLAIEIKGTPVVPDIERLGAVIGDGGVVDAGATLAPGTLIQGGGSGSA